MLYNERIGVAINIRETIQLSHYIDLVNQYVAINKQVRKLDQDREVILQNLKKANNTLVFLNKNNLKVDGSLVQYIDTVVSELDSLEETKKTLTKLAIDLDTICRTSNVRYVVHFVAKKENISLKELSIKVGCKAEAFDILVSDLYISGVDLVKLCEYYGIWHMPPEWQMGNLLESA